MRIVQAAASEAANQGGDLLNTGITAAIVIVVLFLFYRALKEPIDLMFGAIKKGLGYIGEKISGAGGKTIEVIKYE